MQSRPNSKPSPDEPPGPRFARPEDKLRDIRDLHTRISLRMRGTGVRGFTVNRRHRRKRVNQYSRALMINGAALEYWVARSSDDGWDCLSSQLRQQGVAAGDLDLAGRRLEVEFFHDAVFHQHRVTLGADAESVAGSVQFHADRLGEFGVAVGKEDRLVALVGVALPCAHDERVIDGHHGDGVDALGLDGVGVEKNARHVHLVAGAGIGSGPPEQRNFLSLEQLVGGLLLPPLLPPYTKF